MDSLSAFRAEIDAFLARTGMRPTVFGLRAIGDRSFISSLRRGRAPRIDTIDRVRAFMRSHTPAHPSEGEGEGEGRETPTTAGRNGKAGAGLTPARPRTG